MVDPARNGCAGREDGTVLQEELPFHEETAASVPRAVWWQRNRAWIEPIGLLILALALNLAGNDRTGLWDRDEPRYAVCVREMRARGDWIFPTYNGQPRYHKPILIYWLMGLGTALAGDNPFGARLVSACAGAVTVLGVWALGRRMFGPRGGWPAALILATAPIIVAESKLATTDATLALWLLGSQFCLWELGRGASRLAAGLFWVFLSLATMTKGPVGPALIASAWLLAWLLGWRTSAWQRLHWRAGLAGLMLLTLPWYLAISIASGGDFLRFAVGRQIVHRLASDMEAHGGFPGYYPLVSTLAFYPWSAFFPAALLGAWLRRRSDSTIGFLLGWVLGPLILLECFRTKLIHYYLPAFPACALLVTWLIRALAGEGVNVRRWPLGRLGLALLVGIGLVGTVFLVAGAAILPRGLGPPMLSLAVAIAAGTLIGTWWLQQGATERAVCALAVTWAIVLLACGGWLIPLTEPYRTSRKVGERLASLSTSMGIEPVLLEYQEPGLLYALGRPIATTRDAEGFLSRLKDKRSVLTVATSSEIDVMRRHFGLTVAPLEQVDGFVLTKGKNQSLLIAVVRQENKHVVVPPLAPNVRRVGLKETLVK
jgi:4-amino-4-deoxy-L-arabinose transferase-like glycosyltransferase